MRKTVVYVIVGMGLLVVPSAPAEDVCDGLSEHIRCQFDTPAPASVNNTAILDWQSPLTPVVNGRAVVGQTVNLFFVNLVNGQWYILVDPLGGEVGRARPQGGYVAFYRVSLTYGTWTLREPPDVENPEILQFVSTANALGLLPGTFVHVLSANYPVAERYVTVCDVHVTSTANPTGRGVTIPIGNNPRWVQIQFNWTTAFSAIPDNAEFLIDGENATGVNKLPNGAMADLAYGAGSTTGSANVLVKMGRGEQHNFTCRARGPSDTRFIPAYGSIETTV